MSTIGYIGVSNVARKIKTMYVGVDGLARKVKTAYVGVDNSSRKWISGIDTSDPNTRFELKDLGTWSNVSQVNAFCDTYNHANNYTGLSLGNYVKINTSSYSGTWYIAGFDLEYNRTASDGTVYNNGYGILMMGYMAVAGFIKWGTNISNGYIGSTLHTFVNDPNSNSPYFWYSSILKHHIINRNVLLSNAAGDEGSTSYTWSTEYFSTPSVGQLTGTFASHRNIYDDGEANYKLPLFNFPSAKEKFVQVYTRNIRKAAFRGGYVYMVDLRFDFVGTIDPYDDVFSPCPVMLIR